MSRVTMIVPETVTDPAHPSGGNRYDLRLAEELGALGRQVRVVRVGVAGGTGPPLPIALQRIPDGEAVLVDGLLATADPRTVDAHTRRLGIVVLLHMPPSTWDPDGALAALLGAAHGVVATSGWTRRRTLDALPSETLPAIAVAPPGVDTAPPVARSAGGERLRCVAAVLPHKGQDVLVDALGRIRELDWRCELVGATDLDPVFADHVRHRATALGIADRVRFAGARSPGTVRELYDGADLLVLPSRSEGYGMVVTEALACGLPVVASDVGGVREALGSVGGRLPGLLVRPEDPAELAGALRDWLTRPDLRAALTVTALERRSRLAGWGATARAVSAVLPDGADEPSPAPPRLSEESRETA